MPIAPFVRKRLSFPGTRYGFSYNTVGAFQWGKGVSVVAQGGNIINVFTGKQGAITGTVTQATDGLIGPTIRTSTAGGTNYSTLANVIPSNTPTAATLAALVRIFDIGNVSSGMICAMGSGGNGPGLFLQGALGWNNWGGSNPSASIVPTVNHAYFVIGSSNSTTCNLLTRDLATGVIKTATSAGAAITAQNGTFVANDSNSLGAFGLNGNVAAAMYSPVFMTMAQLQAWADDPWSFWYPQASRVETFLGTPLGDTFALPGTSMYMM